MKTDIVIVGSGVAGLYCALHLPSDKQILILSKAELDGSDSYLAQGGICVLKNEEDYDSFFEDTMKAGHYENRKESVDIMIRSSRSVIDELISYGVDFARQEDGSLAFTREGAHSTPRILFHKDITGKEITSKLLAAVQKLPNVTFLEHTTMLDVVTKNNICYGLVCSDKNGRIFTIEAKETLWACGGLGGLYTHSTNFRHLTGDALAISLKHNIKLENIDYIQIHPTTLYSQKPGRRFLISESVRGEGAVLLDKNGKRFVNELLPRDVVTKEIKKQMEIDQMPYVRLSLAAIPIKTILSHFPNIYQHCLDEGYDVTKEPIPVVPAQHYFMGGVWINSDSQTSMQQLYCAGEASCNGVHGANRLASNSLLESLVFARRAAAKMTADFAHGTIHEHHSLFGKLDLTQYEDLEALQETYRTSILEEIERMKQKHEHHHIETECRQSDFAGAS